MLPKLMKQCRLLTSSSLNPIAQRMIKFVASGLVTTAFSYVSFVTLTLFMRYDAAALCSWMLTVSLGFAVNRRFTFGIKGGEGGVRQLVLFVVGAGLQLLLAEAGYAVLIGRLKFNPSAAFACLLVFTSSFSFGFMSLVAFRRRSGGQ